MATIAHGSATREGRASFAQIEAVVRGLKSYVVSVAGLTEVNKQLTLAALSLREPIPLPLDTMVSRI